MSFVTRDVNVRYVVLHVLAQHGLVSEILRCGFVCKTKICARSAEFFLVVAIWLIDDING